MSIWLLGLLPLIGLVGLMVGVFGLKRARSPLTSRRHLVVAGFAVVLLAASGYFGWPGPFGSPGKQLGTGPDAPRRPGGDVLVQTARAGLPVSNRGTEPRVIAVSEPTRADVGNLILRANDGSDLNQMRRQISRDSWLIFKNVYTSDQLNRIQRVDVLATHPQGTGESVAGEPLVATISLERANFTGVQNRGELPQGVAQIHWYIPAGNRDRPAGTSIDN